MLSFGLRSTSDDQLSDLSDESWLKCEKRPPMSSKNKMFIFGLRSTSDDWPSNPSKKHWLKCKKNQKKGPLSHQKIKCSFLDYDQPSNPSKKRQLKCKKNKKGPLSHQKIKCSFLDYIQLLMIGRAIRAKNVDRNTKKQKRPLKSLKNKMFIFGLHSTSDDWPSHLSDEWWLKCKKRPPKS